MFYPVFKKYSGLLYMAGRDSVKVGGGGSLEINNVFLYIIMLAG